MLGILHNKLSLLSNLLLKRVSVVIFFLILYRMGTFIPLPGINIQVLNNIMQEHAHGVLGMFNVFTGGAVGRMSIFSLNIMPFVTASIIVQLCTIVSKDLFELSRSSEEGKMFINQYIKYLAVVLALFQGYGIASALQSEIMSYNGISLVRDNVISFKLLTVISLTAGTVIVIWFGEQISEMGIGNGSSLIIFTGIVSGLAPSIYQLLEMERTNIISMQLLFICFILFFVLICIIVFIEGSMRKIFIQYPRRQIGNKVYGGQSSFLPIKVNISGVAPPIFAHALLLIPTTIANFSFDNSFSKVSKLILLHLDHGKTLFIVIYLLLIVFFCFFYAGITFNTVDIAYNLRKTGGIIMGKRPGFQTSNYLRYILFRITTVSAIYMCIICFVPELFSSQFKLPLYLGGTSLLILVSVVLDTITQIQVHLTNKQYNRLMRKINIMRKQ